MMVSAISYRSWRLVFLMGMLGEPATLYSMESCSMASGKVAVVAVLTWICVFLPPGEEDEITLFESAGS